MIVTIAPTGKQLAIVGSTGMSTLISGVLPDLATHISNSIALYISGSVNGPGDIPAQLYYPSRSYSPLSFTKNPQLAFQPVVGSWSCIPVASSINGDPVSHSAQLGCLVAPDIIIEANHAFGTGIYYFVDTSGTLVTSSYSQSVAIGSSYQGDLLVTQLTPPLTASVVPALVMDKTAYSGSLVKIQSGSIASNKILSVYSNQYKQLFVGRIAQMDFRTTITGSQNPSESVLFNWYEPIVGGDSGSPFGVIVNGKFVVLGTWYGSDFTGSSTGPSAGNHISAINSTITNFGSTSSLSPVNLSGFRNYTQ